MAPNFVTFTARAAGDATTPNSSLNPTLIIGIVVAVVLFLGIALWLGIRYYRKKSSSERQDNLGSAFLSVRGVTKDGQDQVMTDRQPGNMFSREQMSNGVVMPEKAVLRPNATREEILEHYTAEGKLPRPFAPFMTGANANAPSGDSNDVPSTPNRYSVLSFLSVSSRRLSTASTASSLSVVGKRKIRQLFNPVLPDELVVSLGEQFAVVQSFDDGWCIVGRDSVFNPGEVELGAVPAWCFIKPAPGLKASRPMRTSSLGVTVDLNAAAPEARDNVMSWSNF